MTLRRFRPYFHYLRAVRGPLVGAVICGLLYGIANGAGLPLMVKKVFPKIFGEHAEPLSTWKIIAISLWLPAIFVVRGVAGYLNSYLIQLAGVRVLERIRSDYFQRLQMLPLSFFHRYSSGDLIARGLGDTNQLQNTLTTVANEILKQPATLIGSVCTLAYLAFTEQGVVLVLVCLGILPLCIFPVRYVGRKLLQRAEQLQARASSLTERFTENLAGLKEVRAFSLEEKESQRFARESDVLVRAQMKVAKYDKALTPAIEIISAIGIAVTFVYAYQTHLKLEVFITIITALYMSYEPVKKLGALNNEIQRGSAALDRLEVILNEPMSIADPVKPVNVGRLSGDIAFEKVTFAYKPGEPVLRDLTVPLSAGTVCALVGPSGAGKTTFANLVPRFYEVVSGRVCIDGIDVRDMRLADLRRNIAVVSQDPVLFNESIYDNLLIGRPNATRAEVEQAARNAFAHDFIINLEGGLGYDTIVGERGGRLSGGQKQRIAIARAFLRDAPILILDEATSALDSDSEAAVQAALQKLMTGKTVLIIAHRFSTIRDATKILVFNQGEIVATGTHSELYSANALYKSLYDRQHSAPAA